MNRIILICTLLTAFCTGFFLARDTEGSWDRVTSISPGQNMVVVTQKMKSYTGKMEFANDAVLTLSVDGTSMTFARPEVFRVSLRPKNRRARNVLIGAAIGAGAGFAAGAAFGARYGESSESGEPHASVLFGTLGLLPGAGAGALVGAFIPVNQTVYRAEVKTAPGEGRQAAGQGSAKGPKDEKDQQDQRDNPGEGCRVATVK
ncbi:MAG: hypothetical protein KA419_06315 [Acidobacteria bacterium]|nr:hypothetical protein [Acidobacteriota bacterium]